MSFLQKQDLEIQDSGAIILTNTMNNDSLLQSNYEERKAVDKAKGSPFRPVASIEVSFLENDPKGLGQMVLAARSGTPEFKVALRKFLGEYPAYKTSNTRI